MFANRISGFYMDDYAQEPQDHEGAVERAGFAPLPAFALTSGNLTGGNLSSPPDIYRLAYEQAQRQVARRREMQRHLHEWN
ncbi:MAG: hypothetical protein L0211_02790 [Planctomycetaceae bacterium]|nr:hypothetical protein [Planctomycetaceae bacterium]